MSPSWDESFQPSIVSEGRWPQGRPVLDGSCGRLDGDDVERWTMTG